MKKVSIAAAAFFMLAVGVVSAAPTASALQSTDGLTLQINPKSSSVVLGESLDIEISVINNGVSASDPIVIHLDITAPSETSSVDPEDWTPTLNQAVGAIPPGETVVVEWTIQPISAGTFVTYAVALSPGASSVAISDVLEVRVADHRSLNPGGILPVAVAAPTLVGSLLLFQMRRGRRNGPS